LGRRLLAAIGAKTKRIEIGTAVIDMRSRSRAEGAPLSEGAHPNSLWCADYKGEFMLGDRRCCYPLTVTDHASRCLLL
jgi:hypothetical protein